MYLDLEPEDFKRGLQDDPEVVLIDIRTPEEIEEWSLEGHLHVNMMSPDFMNRINTLDREKTYYLYCRSGNRSAHACMYMVNIGFEHVAHLAGGMIAWRERFENE